MCPSASRTSSLSLSLSLSLSFSLSLALYLSLSRSTSTSELPLPLLIPYRRTSLSKAWLALPGTTWSLEQSNPLNANNLVYLRVTAAEGTAGGGGGMVNQGFDGIPVARGKQYYVSLWARCVAYVSALTSAVNKYKYYTRVNNK